MDRASLVDAAVRHCARDPEGLLKIGDLWLQPEKEWQKHELLKRHPELKAQVMVRLGGDWRGKYADEETARKIAALVDVQKLWRAPEVPEEEETEAEETAQQAPPAVAVQEAPSSLEEEEQGSLSSSSGSEGADLSHVAVFKEENASPSESLDDGSDENRLVVGPITPAFPLANELNLVQMEVQLAELLGHEVNLKSLRTSPDKLVALIDITVLFTGLSANNAGEVVRKLLPEHPEVQGRTVKLKFPGRGQRPIDVLPIEDAISFAFLLPGKAAAQMRFQAAKLLVRYIGGDVTLVQEVYANRGMQEDLSAAPPEDLTPEEEVVRMCGEAVEASSSASPSRDAPFRLPPAPIIIESEKSVGLPGSDHLYAALRVEDNFMKVGVSKDVLDRTTGIARYFQGTYDLLAVWPREAVLEDIVLEKLRPYRAQLGTSREHFDSRVTLENLREVVDLARELYLAKMATSASSFQDRKRELEFQEDLSDRASKRRREELAAEAERDAEKARLQMQDRRERLLEKLVEDKNPEAIKVFLENFSRS
jgi:hypothetical protein